MRFNNSKKHHSTKEELIDSIIGIGNIFKGEFKLSSALRVDGILEGEIITNSRLHISKLGRGRGIIKAKNIEIGGEFQGDLIASNNIIIKSSAFVKANIKASLLTVEEGAHYSGKCSIKPNNIELIPKRNKQNNIINKEIEKEKILSSR